MTLKQDIRQHITHKRKALSKDIITHKAALARKEFIPLLEYHKPKIIAAYQPIHNEFNIAPIIEYCKNKGIKILYPRVNKKASPLTFHETSDFKIGAFGIQQPPENAPQYMPDMMICPFIGVDKNNKRLGFGGGFYDRTLAKMPNIITIAIGYDFQYSEDFSAEPHDMIFDYVILL